MRILEHHVDPISGHTYAVIVNPIAGGLVGQPAYRYRLICAHIPNWIERADTVRSISRTPGILIYETYDVLESWLSLENSQRRIAGLIRKARVLGGAHHLVTDIKKPRSHP